MLSPKRQFVLLPQDREIMAATGMTEEEYRWFVKEKLSATARSVQAIQLPELSFEIMFFINLALSLLLAGVAYLLTPKPSQEKDDESSRQKGCRRSGHRQA